MQPEEYPLLREFLCQAIFLPDGTVSPSRSIINLPELQIYIAGILLFSREDGVICFLSVDPTYRRQHIAQQMISFMLTQMDAHKDITYREGDPNSIAARALYKSLGFSAEKLTEEFDYPVQEFILKR